METNNNNFFIPKFLEKELKILEATEFNYSNTYKAFFNFTNNYSLENYKKLIVKDTNISKPVDSGYTSAKEDSLSMIIPNCSRDFIFKILKNFHIQNNEKNEISKEFKYENNKNKDEVECCHQKKLKEKESKDNSNPTIQIQKKYSLIGNLYSKTFSKIFGNNENHDENIFNKIEKINNIDYNCDYFHAEIKSNRNSSALSKLKSKFVNNYKNYDLFRYFYEKYPICLSNKKKHLDINSNNNNLINDTESQNIQSQIISQNNDETTDDCNNFNAKNVKDNLYQSKNALNKYNLNCSKNPNFTMFFFKFIDKVNKRSYNDSNTSFTKDANLNPEEEFVFVVSLIEIANPLNKIIANTYDIILNNTDKTNSVPINDGIFNDKNQENKENKIYTKVNFGIFTKIQIEKIEHYLKNEQEGKNFIKELLTENLKITLFCELIENMKSLILSKIKAYNGNYQSSKEEEDFILKNLFLLEHTNNQDSYFIKKNISPIIKSNEMKLDLIEIDFCKNNEGYNSNRSNSSGKFYFKFSL
jgi:hypothetical protein